MSASSHSPTQTLNRPHSPTQKSNRDGVNNRPLHRVNKSQENATVSAVHTVNMFINHKSGCTHSALVHGTVVYTARRKVGKDAYATI